jgi:Arc/MetJ family transcription regulator
MVRKTTIEIDDQLYERARRALGTTGLKATVHRAFEEVLAQQAREEVIRQLRDMDGLDLDKPEVMATAWR